MCQHSVLTHVSAGSKNIITSQTVSYISSSGRTQSFEWLNDLTVENSIFCTVLVNSRGNLYGTEHPFPADCSNQIDIEYSRLVDALKGYLLRYNY